MNCCLRSAILLSLLLLLLESKQEDLYSILGVKRTATESDIKRAYRQKARESHPDKNPHQDKDEATEAFRKIASAYEILSDKNSRLNYDRTGGVDAQDTARQQREREFWNQHFGRQQHHHQQQHHNTNRHHQQQQQQYQHQQQYQQQQQHGQQHSAHRKYHRYLYDPHLRRQINDARSRVISIKSLGHLEFIATEDTGSNILERYVILAFYDSSMSECEHTLDHHILYPWPYAGYSTVPQSGSGIWWDEVMLTAKVDLKNRLRDPEINRLANFFRIGAHMQHCPMIAYFPRGGTLKDFQLNSFADTDGFTAWIWSKLKMTVTFVNRSPYDLKIWWLDGSMGKPRGLIEKDRQLETDTFLSHSFIFRASHVEGNTLTNESSLLWYTSVMEDDKKFIYINHRCFDNHGDCVRWRNEGFCDKSSNTIHIRQNPGFHDWVMQNCFVSCKVGCGNPRKERRAREKADREKAERERAEREKRDREIVDEVAREAREREILAEIEAEIREKERLNDLEREAERQSDERTADHDSEMSRGEKYRTHSEL